MPTQNFLSTDFFLLSSEEEARKLLFSLPSHYTNVTLLRENSLVHSTRFLFENTEKQVQHYIDVSLLPLNDQHVLVKLHGSYTNGKSFHADPDLMQALKQFELFLFSLQEKDSTVTGRSNQTASTEKKAGLLNQLFFSLFARSV